MMKCEEINKVVDEYLDNTLAIEHKLIVDTHVKHCQSCKQRIEAESRFRSQLRAIPVQPPSAGFENRALHTAINHNLVVDHKRKQGFVLGFASAALVASIGLWVIVTLMPSVVGNNNFGELELITVSLHQQKELNLNFHSQEKLKGAKISLKIPENIELVGFKGERQITWLVDLVKGKNLLTLPIKANLADNGQLVAQIEHGKQTKVIRIDVNVVEHNVIQFYSDIKAVV